MCHSKFVHSPQLKQQGENPCSNNIKVSPSSLSINDLLATATPLSEKGSQAEIFKCLINSNQKVLMKRFPKDNSLELDTPFKREADALSRLRHPNIPSLITTFESKYYYYLVREHVDGIDLLTYLNSMPKNSIPEEQLRLIFKQLISLVQYCHEQEIFHCDIKLENIIINNDKIYLIDFGLATTMKFTSSSCGTLKYTAPEVLLNQHHSTAIQDIWSCGVVLYALCYDSMPFDGSNHQECYLSIVNESPINFPSINSRSQSLISLMKGLLSKTPQRRLTIEGIISHSWFSSVSVSKPQTIRPFSMFNSVIKV